MSDPTVNDHPEYEVVGVCKRCGKRHIFFYETWCPSCGGELCLQVTHYVRKED